MTFTTIHEAPPRLNRSQQAVFAHLSERFEPASRSACDVVFFELEDNVPPDKKELARRNIIEALNDIDWGDKSVCVRVNGLDTPYLYRDLVDLLEAPTERLDLIMIPKAGTAADIYAVDAFVTQIESAMGRTKKLGFQIMIETALGMTNVYEIAAASPRNDSLHFGGNDYALSVHAKVSIGGGPHPDYGVLTHRDADGRREFHWGDMWHYALDRLVVAARSSGLRIIDGPFGDLDDLEGFRAAANRAAVLGFDGKWTRTEDFVAIANEVFGPSPVAVEAARRLLTAVDALPDGTDVVDGKPISVPEIRQARILIEQAEKLGM
jgi:malyl-CoA/(S)-citramalyl-CoA lyase